MKISNARKIKMTSNWKEKKTTNEYQQKNLNHIENQKLELKTKIENLSITQFVSNKKPKCSVPPIPIFIPIPEENIGIWYRYWYKF